MVLKLKLDCAVYSVLIEILGGQPLITRGYAAFAGRVGRKSSNVNSH